MISTYTNQETKPLTIEDIKKCSEMLIEKEEKLLPKGTKWFEKVMNKFGWHRKYTLIVMDKQKFNYFPNNFDVNI